MADVTHVCEFVPSSKDRSETPASIANSPVNLGISVSDADSGVRQTGIWRERNRRMNSSVPLKCELWAESGRHRIRPKLSVGASLAVDHDKSIQCSGSVLGRRPAEDIA